MRRIANYIADMLIQNGIVHKQNKEVYNFGIEQLLFMLLNFITALSIAGLAGMLLEGLIFMLTYLPLRKYAGGLHAKTRLQCYIGGMLFFVGILYFIKIFSWPNEQNIFLLIISSVIIFCFSPAENKAKKLSDFEKQVYRKKTLIVLGIELMVILMGSILINSDLIKPVMSGIMAESLILIVTAVAHCSETDGQNGR